MSAPLLRLAGVARSFSGPTEVRALTGIDLSVDRGEYLSIVGPSGSGKSTLLNILGLLDQPTAGEYTLDGTDTTLLDPGERNRLRAREIGFVFQSFHLLASRSALDNVLMGMLYNRTPRHERQERARRVLSRLGLGHRTDFLPPVLSGGERQRVAIARAIAAAPAVLLADEPTGNLDGETSEEVLSIFDELHHDGLTLLVITHDEQVARRAARSIRITEGRLEEIR
ncbi:ABC transporter ATP-binding protein [Microbacterium sp. P07]|uniref:ABC transporter ATP-binding protein n=1 Tax=Microbacterium sp. P07 TaxID=3366952 RepID=UPI0037466794